MRHSDLCAALTASGIPWTGERWDVPPSAIPPLPYAVKCRDSAPTSHADNLTLVSANYWRIELYSRNYDYEAEGRLEAALDTAGFAYALEPVGEVPDSGGVYETCLYVTTID